MKKSIFCMMAATALFAACDPGQSEKDYEPYVRTAAEIESNITITQTDADGNPAEDGNYFTYTTNPATMVSVFNYLSDGSENQLAKGYSGSFAIKPKRGSDPNQSFYIRSVDSDNTEVVVTKTYNVFVQQELDPEIRLIASDAYGSKTWKWDATIGDGEVWGNMGYCGGDGADVALKGNGKWWGVGLDADGELSEFMNQLQHTPDGAAHGDESINAYMVFNDEGIASVYDKDGNLIRQAAYNISDYNANGEWRKGMLNTTAILWPYEINSGGNNPGQFEIVYLTPDKMCLVYPDGGAFDGLGSWGEASFWHFASTSDIEGMAFGYGTDTKDWTWDYDGEHEVWGNMGYCGGSGADVALNYNGKWWGVTDEAGLLTQLNHTNDGAAHGDESMDAYFTLSGEGTIVRHAGDGSVINSGSFEFDTSVANDWKVADLNTTAGTILFPYEINSGGNMPTSFEVVYLTGSKMCLVYPDGGDFSTNGSWGEATYWHFKAK